MKKSKSSTKLYLKVVKKLMFLKILFQITAMTTIRLPGRTVLARLEDRAYEITEGQLVMMHGTRGGNLILGAFEKYEEFEEFHRSVTPRVRLKPAYSLRPCQLFGGIWVPIVEYRNGRYFDSLAVSHIKEMYVGKDEIVHALHNMEGFEGHAEWVSRLEEPYRRSQRF